MAARLPPTTDLRVRLLPLRNQSAVKCFLIRQGQYGGELVYLVPDLWGPN